MTPNFKYREDFSLRHNNVEPADVAAMLKEIGVADLNTLINQTVPEKFVWHKAFACLHRKQSLNSYEISNKSWVKTKSSKATLV